MLRSSIPLRTHFLRKDGLKSQIIGRLLQTSAISLKEETPTQASVNKGFEKEYPAKRGPADVVQANKHWGGHRRRTLSSFSMEGKVCVVTGAARGLGNTFCRAFIESGCTQLAILDLRQEEADKAADELTKWAVENGDLKPGELDVRGYGIDVASESSVQSTFDEIVGSWGTIHALVTAAGIVENFSALTYPTDRIRRLFDINVHGSFFCAREAARHMLANKTKGSIILISSMSANIINVPQPQTPYNASKAAVKHMAASLATEWAKDGIRVNALAPGYMMTSLTRGVLAKNEDLKNSWEEMTPMGRLGEPEELKGAIVYLASDASSFMTGAQLVVDGGYCAV